MELLFKDEVYKVIGSALQVYNELGSGFLEAVYQEALEIEFNLQQIPYTSQMMLPIYYKSQKLKKEYIADFIVWDEIIIELKAEEKITEIDVFMLPLAGRRVIYIITLSRF